VQGRIWRKLVARDAVAALESSHQVISTKLLAGRSVVRVYADTRPDETFDAAEATLEDVYFVAMGGGARSANVAQFDAAPPDEAIAPTSSATGTGSAA
jgi:hypothetical protein